MLMMFSHPIQAKEEEEEELDSHLFSVFFSSLSISDAFSLFKHRQIYTPKR